MKDDLRMTPAALAAAAQGDLGNALIAATPGGIERQEAEGQRAMASAFKTLPKDMDLDLARALGFEVGDAVDDIFVEVTAPSGWEIRPTGHAMHSDIVDEQGRIRGSIFYKAAFYDRRASGDWQPRYLVGRDADDQYNTTAFKAVDTATGDVLFSEPVSSRDYEVEREVRKSVIAKLAAQFPDHENPAAYWND